MNNHGSLWVILWGGITWSFSHSTCVTSNRTRRPVAERGHDTVLLAGQLTRSHRAGARAVRTPRQQKHTHSAAGNSSHIHQKNTTARSKELNYVDIQQKIDAQWVGDTNPSLYTSYILKSLGAEQKLWLCLPDSFASELSKDQIKQEYMVWIFLVILKQQ